MSTTKFNREEGSPVSSGNLRHLVISLIAFCGAIATSMIWPNHGHPLPAVERTLAPDEAAYDSPWSQRTVELYNDQTPDR